MKNGVTYKKKNVYSLGPIAKKLLVPSFLIHATVLLFTLYFGLKLITLFCCGT